MNKIHLQILMIYHFLRTGVIQQQLIDCKALGPSSLNSVISLRTSATSHRSCGASTVCLT